MSRILGDALFQEHLVADDLRKLSFAEVYRLAAQRPEPAPGGGCVVCSGRAGPVVDAGDLVRGKTFTVAHTARAGLLELRQYSSTHHDDDMDSFAPLDAVVVMERISKAEQFLMDGARAAGGSSAWVTVEKTRRPRRHGVQRIRLHAEEPPRARRDRRFRERRGADYPTALEVSNPAELTIGEFRGGLTALIPERPRRPLEIVIYFRPSASGFLHELSGDQRWGLAQAIREVTGALRLELTVRGYAEEYRWSLHSGAGQEVYVRVLPRAVLETPDGPPRWSELLRGHLGLD